MRIEYADVCGSVALSQCQERLRALGYREADGQLETGLFSSHASDAAPGWGDWTYCLAVALREGDVLAQMLQGI
jgi:hypothetical protein